MAPVAQDLFRPIAAPNGARHIKVDMVEEAPMSRTHQYRKVMKPLLERKRRARINGCLDELKELMVEALQSEGESITKLEKADVLELTVNHLKKLKRQQMLQANPALDMDRYRSGYTACASEVSRFMSSVPGVNITFGTQLMSHLGNRVSVIDREVCNASPVASPMSSLSPLSLVGTPLRPQLPMSPISDNGYNSGRDSASPPLSVGCPSPAPLNMVARSKSPVWRPF
jgi:hairy-and-enhancer-of-split protein